MTVDIYDPTTWPSLKQRQRELRDKIFELESTPRYCIHTHGQLLLELDSVDEQIRKGHLYEVPW